MGKKKRAVGQQINRLEKKGATEEKSQCVQYFRENPTRRQKSPQWAFKKGVQMQKKSQKRQVDATGNVQKGEKREKERV